MITIFGKPCSKKTFMDEFNKSPYWDNSGGRGTSEIVKISDAHIWYKRGNSNMRISIELVNKIYQYIVEHNLLCKKLVTNDIVDIKNKVDTNYKGWNDCDATFIMMLLRFVLGVFIHCGKPCYIIF